ncbi:hypothetical protein LRY65_00745 [Candidatus Woesebacteria bacterium]|nr:hypothetical protein [Candidatus Woesebacteria bacterium]MCD8507691.1 hypothetical protein [Candidatus Woesebacteria bacterium]MCD8526725.1 hypothetical protein [Candidatus Woesebacteria bacterium]MCD8546533.1 hypothetical protein [Candidatus Woesebacteria bacterium]
MELGSRLLAQAAPQEEGAVNFLEFQDAVFGADRPDNPLLGFADAIVDRAKIETFSTPGGIISAFLPYIMMAAGLILFVMLIWGGFEFMMGAANPKSAEAGKQRITSALIGFFILFSVFWMAQIMQAIFGINIGIQ